MDRHRIRVLCLVLSFLVYTEIGAIEENQGWPVDWHMNMSCPLIIDFNADDSLEVIIGCVGDLLGVWNSNGKLLDGCPIILPNPAYDEICGGDVDNDGRIEVVIAVWDTSTTALALRSDGTQPEGWPFDLPAKATVAPALYDLDGDGKLEILVSSTSSNGGTYRGRVGVYSSKGDLLSGWPFFIIHRLLETTPSVADIDMDGDFEIVFATYEDYFWGPGWIHVYNHDGTPFTGSIDFKKLDNAICTPPVSLVDIHGDQKPEIIGCDNNGLIHILDIEGDYVPGWPQSPSVGKMCHMPVAIDAKDGPARFLWGESDAAISFIFDSEGNMLPDWPYYGPGTMRSQPVVGDLDGEENDATPEAFLGGSRPYDVVLDFYAEYPEGWPVYIDNQDFGTGALTDLDGDGDTDIMFLDYSGNFHAYDTPGVYRHDLIECPRYMYDNWHTGAYHKDLYREAESAREIIGWTTVHDTTAWGHYCLRPVSSLEGPGRYQLTYRTQVPVWKNYSVWVRVRKLVEDKFDFSPEVTLDGKDLQGGSAVEDSPDDWRWLELGEVQIKPGSHEFKITLGRCRHDVDRILFTTHNSLPLLDESPHEWQIPCPGCAPHVEQCQPETASEEPAGKKPTLLSKIGGFLAGLTR